MRLTASNETVLDLSRCLETSPSISIKRKKIDDLTDATKENYKRYFQKKHKVLKKSLKEKFAGVAPGQAEEFISHIMENSSDDSEGDVIPDDLQNLLTKYEKSDGR